MSGARSEVPAFVLEAFEGQAPPEAELDALGRLPELLKKSEPIAAGRARLLSDVDGVALRYAPFFARLSELWDVSESEVERLFERATARSAWRRPGLPGVSLIDVQGGPRLAGAELRLVKFAPGMRFPAHRHLGAELVFVLEGSLHDVSGQVFGPGDLQSMEAGTEHWFRVSAREPCVAASVQYGIEFSGAALRWLTRVFGR